MKAKLVRDLMVPLSEYDTIPEDATLHEAISLLEKVKENYDQTGYRFRVVLVRNKDGHIIGKVSQLDAIKGLEPQYRKIGDLKAVSHFGFRQEFIKSMMTNYGLWQDALEDICRKSATTKVSNVMDIPEGGEYVEDGASLNEAVHRMIIGNYHFMFVTKSKQIVGTLRVNDVFREVSQRMATCKP